jgi:hypothetical protein
VGAKGKWPAPFRCEPLSVVVTLIKAIFGYFSEKGKVAGVTTTQLIARFSAENPSRISS